MTEQQQQKIRKLVIGDGTEVEVSHDFGPQFQDIWNRALNTFGTAYVFKKRAEKFSNYSKWLTYFGLVVPLFVGAVFLSNQDWAPLFTVPAALVIIAQLIMSLLSVTHGWNESLNYSLESATINYELSNRFKALGMQCAKPPSDFETQYADLCARDSMQEQQDNKRALSDKDLRKAHRAGLKQFNRACLTCKLVPESMKPTDCKTCGDF